VSQLRQLRNRERRKLRYLIFLPFDFDVVRAKYTFPRYYLPVVPMSAQITSVFTRLETALVAPLRYINDRNDYFSASSLRRSQPDVLRVAIISQIVVSTLQTMFLVFFARINPFFFYISSLLSRLHFRLSSTDRELGHLNITWRIPASLPFPAGIASEVIRQNEYGRKARIPLYRKFAPS